MRMKLYRHQVRSGSMSAIGTSYASAKRVSVEMGAFPSGSVFIGRIQSLIMQFSSLSSATAVTFRLTSDTSGDETLIPDTTATLDTGITTAADGSAAFKIDIDVGLESGDTIYIWTKMDAGTATLDRAVICWEE